MKSLITTTQGKISVKDEGKGIPIIIIHGGPGMSSSYLIDTISPLSKQYKLIFFDQLSCGESELLESVNEESTITSASEVVKKYAEGGKYHVIAHSWGAYVLATMLNKKLINVPEKIILCNPTPFNSTDFNAVGGKLVERIPKEVLEAIGKEDAKGTDEAGTELMRLALPYYCGRSENLPKFKMEYRIPTYNKVASSMTDFNYESTIINVIDKCFFFFGKTDYIKLDNFSNINAAGDLNLTELNGGHFSFVTDSKKFIDKSLEILQ